MKDENQRGSGVDRTEAPEPKKHYDGSSNSKNGAQWQEGTSYDESGIENAREYLKKQLQPGRYSVQEIFDSTKYSLHASPDHYIAAAEKLGYFEQPDTIHIPDDRSKVLAALAVIPSDIDYESWGKIGCVLCKLFGSEEGFRIWDQWSSTSETKYPGPDEMRYKWRKYCEETSARLQSRDGLSLRRRSGLELATARI